ncbi:Wings apart-like Wapl [Schizosaccharomyces pombe]|uniref:Wings apart-like protein homolog 1 n=1 Tax=Schizosaccharomyces pombe (strain 972 / ATCC 24843) TaxID=284812 RepID=WAPL_SCHPO|nr:WAPL family protein [Schizosaccharomyces pombe]O94364.1 RecName: Full=Wings apart-like protein homolog 1 [Schizosaccharomyces pombe 972h-]CAA22292.1 Wings apart-like homolog Wpl1 [Schizosaccharomyces pombe]|eukprot:NP_595195.1 WAPL family protein [Schizosaccharomyces pombe]
MKRGKCKEKDNGLKRISSESEVWNFLDVTVSELNKQKRSPGQTVSKRLHKKQRVVSNPDLSLPSSPVKQILRNGLQNSKYGSHKTGLERSASCSSIDASANHSSTTYREQRSYLMEEGLDTQPIVPREVSSGRELDSTNHTIGTERAFLIEEDVSEDDEIQMKSIHELRFAGEQQRIVDEIEYLVDGVTFSGNSSASRYLSLIGIAEKMFDNSFRLCLKSIRDVFLRIFEEIDPKDTLHTFLQIYIFATMANEMDCMSSLLDAYSNNVKLLLQTAITLEPQVPVSILAKSLPKSVKGAVQEFVIKAELTFSFSNESLASSDSISLAAIALMKTSSGVFAESELFTELINLLIEKSYPILKENDGSNNFLLHALCSSLEKFTDFQGSEKIQKVSQILSSKLQILIDEHNETNSPKIDDTVVHACSEKLLRTLIQTVNSNSDHALAVSKSEVPLFAYKILQKFSNFSSDDETTRELIILILGLLLGLVEESHEFIQTITHVEVSFGASALDVLISFYQKNESIVEISGYVVMILSHCFLNDPKAFAQLKPLISQFYESLHKFKNFHLKLKEELMMMGSNGLAIVSIIDELHKSLQDYLRSDLVK